MRFSNVDFQTGLRFEMIITLVTLKSCILTGLLLVSYQLQSSPVVDLQVCSCETQRFTDQKLSSTIFTCPVPSRPSRIGDISIYANIYSF